MLVLTRRHGERIHIGEDIEVTVLEIGRDHVRLGILAPASVAVHRDEVYQEILVANKAAATGTELGTADAVPVTPRPNRPRRPIPRPPAVSAL
jgi:carbon storage regulator